MREGERETIKEKRRVSRADLCLFRQNGEKKGSKKREEKRKNSFRPESHAPLPPPVTARQALDHQELPHYQAELGQHEHPLHFRAAGGVSRASRRCRCWTARARPACSCSCLDTPWAGFRSRPLGSSRIGSTLLPWRNLRVLGALPVPRPRVRPPALGLRWNGGSPGRLLRGGGRRLPGRVWGGQGRETVSRWGA